MPKSIHLGHGVKIERFRPYFWLWDYMQSYRFVFLRTIVLLPYLAAILNLCIKHINAFMLERVLVRAILADFLVRRYYVKTSVVFFQINYSLLFLVAMLNFCMKYKSIFILGHFAFAACHVLSESSTLVLVLFSIWIHLVSGHCGLVLTLWICTLYYTGPWWA